MLSYIIRRLLLAVLVTVIVSIIVFILIRAIPGDPIEIIVASEQLKSYTPEMIEDLRAEKGMSGPLPLQYLRWANDMIHGNFGDSLMYGTPIAPVLRSSLVTTLTITLTAFCIGWIVGPILGVLSAVRRGKWVDDVVTVFANVGITAPTFWLAILFIFAFAVKAKLFPIYGYTLPWDNFALSVKQGFLPVLVTAFLPIASSARQMRSSVLDTLGEDYIRTAWAKGLNERKTLLKHVFKNSIMPVVTLQGGLIGAIVGGSVVIEKIFVIPGLGLYMIQAMQTHDYPIIQAVAVVMTIVIVIANLVIDLLYCWLDPRIQYE
jgi:peptide/nickel transport system permease protein